MFTRTMLNLLMQFFYQHQTEHAHADHFIIAKGPPTTKVYFCVNII